MLAQIVKMWGIPLLAVFLFMSTAQAQTSQPFSLAPLWEKINGEWNFNKTDESSRRTLLYITTIPKNKENKNLHIKDLVKLPFIVFVPKSSNGAPKQ